MMCGGTTNVSPADEEIQGIVDQVKDQVLAETNKIPSVYQAVLYSTQIVAGTNYFVKVKVGDNDYVHLRIYRPLPPNQNKLELSSLQENKSESDPLAYF